MSKNYNKMFEQNPIVSNDELVPAFESFTVVDVISNPISAMHENWDVVPLKEVPTPKEPELARVDNCKKVNLRKSPDITSEVLTVLILDSEVLVEDILDGWAYVITATGIVGYIMDKYIKF